MITSLAVGGVTISTDFSTGYIFTQLEGFEYPEVAVEVNDRGDYHGAVLGNYVYRERNFVISGMVYGTTVSNFASRRRALEQAFALYGGVQTMTITTKDSLSLRASVIVRAKFTQPYQKGSGIFCNFIATIVAVYPFIEAASATTTSLSVFSGGGGAIPAEIPFSLGVGGSGTVSITNNGNGQAYPTITITGPIQNPSLQNTTTGLTLSISKTLSTSTDTIVLDFYNRTALQDGITNILSSISGSWWVLEPGANSVKLTASSSGAGAAASLVHRDSYLGI